MRCLWFCLGYGSIKLILLCVELWSSCYEKAASWATITPSLLNAYCSRQRRKLSVKAKGEGCPSCKIFCVGSVSILVLSIARQFNLVSVLVIAPLTNRLNTFY